MCAGMRSQPLYPCVRVRAWTDTHSRRCAYDSNCSHSHYAHIMCGHGRTKFCTCTLKLAPASAVRSAADCSARQVLYQSIVVLTQRLYHLPGHGDLRCSGCCSAEDRDRPHVCHRLRRHRCTPPCLVMCLYGMCFFPSCHVTALHNFQTWPFACLTPSSGTHHCSSHAGCVLQVDSALTLNCGSCGLQYLPALALLLAFRHVVKR